MDVRIDTAVGRRTTSLLIACAALLGAHAVTAAAPSDAVPLVKGLVFTTTIHAGLTTSAGSVPVADTETVYSIAATDADRIGFHFSISAPSDPSASKLLDEVPRSFDREVRRADLRSAARLTILYSSTDPAAIPGQTFGTTSSAVLQALHDAGRIAFILGINEPEKGLESLAWILPSLNISRHYYRGTLERVGTEPFSVLLDGKRTTVQAVHARGTLTFNDRTITPQILWLDDANNPLTLKWTVGSVHETVTRIDRASEGPGSAASIAESLMGTGCRAELSGVYFTTASAQVLDASMPALQRFAALVSQHPDWRITIEGHTDNIGSAAYNIELSTRRAEAVRDVLVRRFSVPASRLLSRGYGLTRPVETNATDEGRAHNRRVEVSRQCNG